MSNDGGDPFARRFEITAKQREVSADTIELADRETKRAEAALAWLARHPDLSGEQLVEAQAQADELSRWAATHLAKIVQLARTQALDLESQRLDQPESVGTLLAQADADRSTAAALEQIVATLRYVHELRRRLPPE